MLTEARWQKEQELMRSVFPEFRPFTRGTRFGFEGHLRGPRSGWVYGVTLDADEASYPQMPPSVGMHPRIGIHWIGEGERRRLCVDREWRPARSTFANTLLALVRYLDEHDPQPGTRSPAQADGENAFADRGVQAGQDAESTFWPARFWRGRGPY